MLTETKKQLILALYKTPLSEDDQLVTLAVLKAEEQQRQMIQFLQENPNATEQEVLNETGRLIKMMQQR